MLSIIAVIALISAIIYQAPVDPASLQFGQRSDPESIQRLRNQYFLDKPFGLQVWYYLEDLSPLQWVRNADVRLQNYHYRKMIMGAESMLIIKKPYLRKSYASGEEVGSLIYEALPGTLWLGFSAFTFALCLGIGFGIFSALYFDTWVDQFIVSTSVVFYSIPSYIAAILFALIFAYYLGPWTGLPVQGSIYGLDDMGNEIIEWRKLWLPSIALGVRPVAMIAQMTRASLLEVMQEPFITTVKAKGVQKYSILLKHIFPNALNPIITTLSGWLASLLTGAFFVEYVFNFRGLGDLTIQGLSQFDVPLVLGCCVITVTIFIVVNTLVDIAYMITDPRIKI